MTETRSKVVVQCRKKGLTFDKFNYPDELKEYIGKEEWAQIAEEANRAIGTAWTNKKTFNKITAPKWMVVTSIITVILLIIFFATLYIYGKSDEDATYLLVISMICIGFSLFMSLILTFYNYFRKLQPIHSFSYYINKELNAFLNKLNIKYENVLTFHFKEDPYSIECNILNKQRETDRLFHDSDGF